MPPSSCYTRLSVGRDVWNELKSTRADFSTVLSAVSQAYGQDFFSYVQKHWQNLGVRRKYKIQTPENYTLFDSSLKESWNASLVLAALDKQLREMGWQKGSCRPRLV